VNQDVVKEKLESLGVHETDFAVIFSGKASRKVNGLYKPGTKEIILHNKNFKNDNALMFTAIHEMVHHIAITRKLVKTKSAHPTIFWALFHSLLEIAIEKGIYTDTFETDPELKAQGEKVMAVLKEQVEAQKRLGGALHEMQAVCQKKGARFEDFLDRHARIPKNTYQAAVRAQLELFDMEDVSPQVVELVSTIDGEKRSEATARIGEGQSIQQVRAAVKNGMVIDPRVDPADEDESDEALLGKLLAQRKKLAEKVANMTVELEGLDVMIETVKARLPHFMLAPDEGEA
jgi:hypothetical protein